MSSHFSANQYENAYNPRRLQNYEIPRKGKDFPDSRKGHTVVISNERGHLLPGIARSKESPWGTFKGTWDDEKECKKTKHSGKYAEKKWTKASSLKANTEKGKQVRDINELPSKEKSATPEITLDEKEEQGPVLPEVPLDERTINE